MKYDGYCDKETAATSASDDSFPLTIIIREALMLAVSDVCCALPPQFVMMSGAHDHFNCLIRCALPPESYNAGKQITTRAVLLIAHRGA